MRAAGLFIWLMLFAVCVRGGERGGRGSGQERVDQGALRGSAETARRHVTVAVFTFANLTGSNEHAWIGHGFAEALTNKLRNVDQIHPRDRRTMADLARVTAIDQDALEARNAGEVGKLVGSDYLIFGAVQAAGTIEKPQTPLRVTCRLVDVRTGRIYRAQQADGTMADLFALQSRLALAFAEQLDVDVSVVAKSAMQQHGTDSPAAYKLYCEGLRHLDAQRYAAAMSAFRAAQTRHPGIFYAEAHHALGVAYLRSDRKHEMLLEFRGDAARLAPVWFDLGVAYERNGEYDKAADALKTFIAYTDRRFAPWIHRPTQEAKLPAAAVNAPHLVFLGRGGRMHCLDTRSGRLLWKKSVPTGKRGPPVVLMNGYAYFGTDDGTLYCLHAAIGEVRWRAKLPAPIPVRVLVVPGQNLVVAADAEGGVNAVDAGTGERRWRRAVGESITMLDGGTKSVFLADRRGTLYALALADGAAEWERQGEDEVRLACRHGGQLVVLGTSGALTAYALADGAVLWRYAGVAAPGPAVLGEGHVVVTLADETLALIAPDGAERWRHAPVKKPLHLLVKGDRVIYADERTLVFLDPATGRIARRQRLPEAIAELRLVDELLLLKTRDGVLHAFGLYPTGDKPDDLAGYLRLGEVFERMEKTGAATKTYRMVLAAVDPHCRQAMVALARLYRQEGHQDEARAMELAIRELAVQE